MTDAAQLERETEQTRAELEGTLDELRQRITPGQMVDQLMERARDGNAGAFVRNFGQQVAANPIPVAVIGVGLAWLMIANKQPQQRGESEQDYETTRSYSREFYSGDGAGYQIGDDGSSRPALRGDPNDRFSSTADDASDMAHDAADRLSGTARDAQDKVRNLADRSRARLGDTAASMKDSLHHGASSARHGVQRAAAALGSSASEAGMMTRRVFDFCKEQPLIIAGLGLAIGAALGAAFPATRTEDELVGEASDEVKRRASGLADKVSAAASPVMGRPDDGVSDGYDAGHDFAAGSEAGSDLTGRRVNAAGEREETGLPGGIRPQQDFGGTPNLRITE